MSSIFQPQYIFVPNFSVSYSLVNFFRLSWHLCVSPRSLRLCDKVFVASIFLPARASPFASVKSVFIRVHLWCLSASIFLSQNFSVSYSFLFARILRIANNYSIF